MTLTLLHCMAGLVVLAEALNKIERTDLFDGRGDLLHRLLGVRWLLVPWRWRRPHVIKVLKLLAWLLMSIAAAVALASPFMYLPGPRLADVAMLGGFALLIVRSRLKEG
jgi:hypothetical protein